MKTFENSAFIAFDNDEVGLLFDDSSHPLYPIKYYNVINGIGLETREDCSYYGFVYKGNYGLVTKLDQTEPYDLLQGMYYSISGTHLLIDKNCTNDCKAIVIEVEHNKGIYPKNKYSAVFTMGGPIEEKGRLNYIDGCTDSLLIPPVKMGDPCFNHLHFPTSIVQTPHTHPSHRIGIVARGEGLCVTPFGNLRLEPGMIFVIKEWNGEDWDVGLDGKQYEVGNHKFNTGAESMDVIAFHPDSDFGPTDEVHPMINRTIVDGIPASEIDEIRTKDA